MFALRSWLPPVLAAAVVLLSAGELAAQPFVADYLEDLAEQDREISRLLAQANQVLIWNGDAVIASCITFDRPRDYTIVFREPAFAQKHAQQLWTTCAHLQRWDWLKRIRFLSMEGADMRRVPMQPFDLVYQWMSHSMQARQAESGQQLRQVLRPSGSAFVTGPAALGDSWKKTGITVMWQERIEELPTFRMHRAILPKARLHDDLTLYCLKAG